ncbi:hypothetical protein M153_36400001482, partial [Pseudoloma neurophilia]
MNNIVSLKFFIFFMFVVFHFFCVRCFSLFLCSLFFRINNHNFIIDQSTNFLFCFYKFCP